MAREIKFRAKNTKNELVYGGYAELATQGDYLAPSIIDSGFVHAVNAKTLGQFTGSTDKNGKEIYEGDVVIDKQVTKGVVKYIQSDAAFKIESDDGRLFFLTSDIDGLEVIGNIYENPELLAVNNERK